MQSGFLISRRALLAAAAGGGKDYYLYAFSRDPGSSGIYFALSRDAYHFKALNGDQPVVVPQHHGMLTRDPFITVGADGVYHLVWTWGWTRKEAGGDLRIGYANSRDLRTWSRQQIIPIFPNEPKARNAWAPELVYDKRNRRWLIFWSTTIDGRFPETMGQCKGDSNHRIYAMTTTDFKSFSEPFLLFNPGYPVIDATILEDGGRFIMIFKDEREFPLFKRLRVAVAEKPEGPYGGVSEPFSAEWDEGPSIMRLGKDYLVYYDHYREPRHYGAYRSRDLRTWENVSSQMSFPPKSKHGSIIRIPERLAM